MIVTFVKNRTSKVRGAENEDLLLNELLDLVGPHNLYVGRPYVLYLISFDFQYKYS